MLTGIGLCVTPAVHVAVGRCQGPRSDALWPSTVKNYEILEGSEWRDAVLRDNASRLLKIPLLA